MGNQGRAGQDTMVLASKKFQKHSANLINCITLHSVPLLRFPPFLRKAKLSLIISILPNCYYLVNSQLMRTWADADITGHRACARKEGKQHSDNRSNRDGGSMPKIPMRSAPTKTAKITTRGCKLHGHRSVLGDDCIFNLIGSHKQDQNPEHGQRRFSQGKGGREESPGQGRSRG